MFKSRYLEVYLVVLAALAVVIPSAAQEPAAPKPTAQEPATEIVSQASLINGSATWSQFRGPLRSGFSAETGLARSWPEDGPKVLWKRPLGEGFSSLAIVDGRVFTLFSEGDDEFVGAFAVATGEELWRRTAGKKFEEFFGNGPRATPTVDDSSADGSLVYAMGSRGLLQALDAATGDVRWSVDLHKDFPIVESQTLTPVGATPPGPQMPVYGYASSALVDGERLIVETGAKGGRSFIALDKDSGKLLWTALDTEIGYASPVAVRMNGRRQIMALPGSEIISLSPEGDVLWRYPWAWTASQPMFVPPNRVFVSTENDVGAMLLEVSAEGEAQEVWRTRRLKTAWNSSVRHGHHLFGFDNGTLRCLDLRNGEFLWAQRGLGKGNLIQADGLLIVLTDKGRLEIGEASGDGFLSQGSQQVLSGRCWTPPALAEGVFYARNHAEMVAVDLRPSAAQSEAQPSTLKR